MSGKLRVIEYARTEKVPFFGICYGMQMAVIEYARNVLKIPSATTEEIDPENEHKLIIFMPEIDKLMMGGTMRLGAKITKIMSSDSLASKVYYDKL